MRKLTIPDSSIRKHRECVGERLQNYLDRLALHGAISWNVGGARIGTEERAKREKERDDLILALRSIHCREFFSRVARRFRDDDISVARPDVLMDFATDCLRWESSLERREPGARNNCRKVLSILFNFSAFVQGRKLVDAGVDGCILWTKRRDASYEWSAWHFIDSLGVRYCPYCNAETVGNMAYLASDGTRRLHQSDLDHFFPKSEYPLLSLSLYNLVPSCCRCNSRFKGSRNHLAERVKRGSLGVLHPYLDNFSDHFRFEYAPNSLNELYVKKNQKDGPLHVYPIGKHVKLAARYLREYHIAEVYRDFYDSELMAAIKSAALYTPSVREVLEAKYPGISEEELDVSLFRASSDEARFNRHRFAKAICDIRSCFLAPDSKFDLKVVENCLFDG